MNEFIRQKSSFGRVSILTDPARKDKFAQYKEHDIEDAGVGKVPIAPGEKARVIRLEAGAAQHAVIDFVAMNEQHAAVPQRRPLALTRREMAVDRRAPGARELPRPRLDRDLDAIKLDDFGFR